MSKRLIKQTIDQASLTDQLAASAEHILSSPVLRAPLFIVIVIIVVERAMVASTTPRHYNNEIDSFCEQGAHLEAASSIAS